MNVVHFLCVVCVRRSVCAKNIKNMYSVSSTVSLQCSSHSVIVLFSVQETSVIVLKPLCIATQTHNGPHSRVTHRTCAKNLCLKIFSTP